MCFTMYRAEDCKLKLQQNNDKIREEKIQLISFNHN